MTRPKANVADSEPTLTPNLRFPEFRDWPGWKKRMLSYLLSEPKRRNRDLKYGVNEVLSVSGEFGCVNQIELLGRSYAGVSVENYHVVETGDVVYTKSPLKRNPYGIIKANKGKAGIVSTLYAVYRPTTKGHAVYLDYYFSRDYHLNSYLQPIVRKGAKNDMKVNNSDVLTGEVWVPEVEEQKKIAEFLATLDELIGAESQKLDTLKAHKQGLMQQLFPCEGETLPRLRFPEFHSAPEWKTKTVDDLVDTITPPKKLQTSDYLPAGKFPVIDQSQDYICGWTDDEDAVIGDGLPVVVFGDHTCALKFVERPFVQGADGIKILRAMEDVREDFLFYSLQSNPVQQEAYKRHFSTLRERAVSFPEKDSGEQHRIATCLSSLDDLIAAQSDRLAALQTHKQGLLQQLFPSPAAPDA